MSTSTSASENFWSEQNFNIVVSTAILLILAIPVGISNIYLGFIVGESPCIFCGHERFGMIAAGALGIFVLRYGPRCRYIVTLFLVAFFGLFSGLRHWCNRIVDDLGQGFGDAIFGFHTYTWAWIVYWLLLAGMTLVVVFIARNKQLNDEFSGAATPVKRFSPYSKVIVTLSFIIVITNCVQFLINGGVPPYAGSARPARFTFNIFQSAKQWDIVHNYEGLATPHFRFFAAPFPQIPGVNEDTSVRFSSDPAQGPIASLQGTLQVKGKTEIGFPVVGVFGKGNAAGIAYDQANDVFGLVSTDGGLYYVASDLKTVLSKAIVDRQNGDDIRYTVDAAFLGPNKLVALAWNKAIYGADRVGKDKVNENVAWKEFRETTGDLMPAFGSKVRPCLRSPRARMAYTLTIAKDPDSEYFYLVNVPHKNNNRIVVSQYAQDKMLSREGVLRVAKTVALKPEAKITGYYPVGADIRDGKMFLLSKAYNTLLVVDLATFEVVGAYGLPSIGDPCGLAIKGSSLFILSRENAKDVVYEVEKPQ